MLSLILTAITLPSAPAPIAQHQDARERAALLLHALDMDGDGSLSRAEVAALPGSDEPGRFERADRNGDGFISLEELSRVLEAFPQLLGTDEEEEQDRRSAMKSMLGATSMVVDRGVSYLALTEAMEESVDSPVDPLQTLDIYAPAGAKALPVVVMVHGGGWSKGDKAHAGVWMNKAPYFTGKGFLFVSVNYRLAPQAQHPAQVGDLARALVWLRDHVAEYGGDPARLALMGHSAGAHLAALVATDERHLAAQGADLSLLRGVILLDGAAYDLPRRMTEFEVGATSLDMWRKAFGQEGEADGWADASPRWHVAPDKGIAPFLIFYTRRPVAVEMSQDLALALTEAGSPSRAVLVPGADHGGINQDFGTEGDPVARQALPFLLRATWPRGGEGGSGGD